ncbi:MAG: ATP-binding cassette domain-containing protein [Candidatus Hydrogenedens sp.]|nr:ATP-binding cassette domain-containing protein [Candidatus Hydrogenedens sp.]
MGTAPASETPLAYQVRDLEKRYQMGEVEVRALRGVSLDIRAGEFVVILGPSGSGKSTFLNIIGGLDAPSSGHVLFKGDDLSDYSERQRTFYRRLNIGFIFQFYNLMPNLTARENVELATEIARAPLPPDEALDLVRLAPRADHFPAQLSGGEQQRVAIARAIAKRPEVLLCDEPTGALDIETGKVVLNALSETSERLGTTLIVITHNAAIGGMADRVVHMRDGQVHDIVTNARRMSADALAW